MHTPVIASIGGGVVAVAGGLLAQTSSVETIANAGLWASLAGIVGSLAGFGGIALKLFFDEKQKKRDYDEKQKQRDYDLAKLQMVERMDRERGFREINRLKIKDLVLWAHKAKSKYEGLPDPPEIDVVIADLNPLPDQAS